MTTARFWRACGFVLLLLFVQQLVLTHVVDHVAASQQLDDGEADGDCLQCLALSGIQGAGGMPSVDLAASLAATSRPAVTGRDDVPRRPASAHAIRAPPQNHD